MSYFLNTDEIVQTIRMIEQEHLDVRTITLGLSLLDCATGDIKRTADKVYEKICREAHDLVPVGEAIEREFGIPIVNKRVSVTPVALIAGGCGDDLVPIAETMDRAAREVGVNFIGGFSALVQKGFTTGDRSLIASIPEALARTERVCASVNIGSTRAGINMDAVAEMGRIIKKCAALTADTDGLACSKLVVFCNAVEDNPFMAAFPAPASSIRRCRSARARALTLWPRRSSARRLRSRAWVSSSRGRRPGGSACRSASSISRSRRPRRWATAWRAFSKPWDWRSAAPTARPPRSPC